MFKHKQHTQYTLTFLYKYTNIHYTYTYTHLHTQNIPETRLLLLFYPKQKLRPGELPDDKKVNYPIQIDLCYL